MTSGLPCEMLSDIITGQLSPPLTRTRTSLGGVVLRSMVGEGGGTELAIMLVLMAGLRRGVQVVPGRQLGSA